MFNIAYKIHFFLGKNFGGTRHPYEKNEPTPDHSGGGGCTVRLAGSYPTNSVFEGELLEMCSTFDLVISDYGTFVRISGQFTHVSDAHGTTSWLDHVICSSDMQNNVVSIEILEKSPSSDHLALSVTFDIMCKPVTIDKYTCRSNKVRFVWDNATDTDVAHYKKLTTERFTKN